MAAITNCPLRMHYCSTLWTCLSQTHRLYRLHCQPPKKKNKKKPASAFSYTFTIMALHILAPVGRSVSRTHRQTDTQNDYSNPCACAPRVNNIWITRAHGLIHDLIHSYNYLWRQCSVLHSTIAQRNVEVSYHSGSWYLQVKQAILQLKQWGFV